MSIITQNVTFTQPSSRIKWHWPTIWRLSSQIETLGLRLRELRWSRIEGCERTDAERSDGGGDSFPLRRSLLSCARHLREREGYVLRMNGRHHKQGEAPARAINGHFATNRGQAGYARQDRHAACEEGGFDLDLMHQHAIFWAVSTQGCRSRLSNKTNFAPFA